MTNFSNTLSDEEFDREDLMEKIIQSKSPADAAKEIMKKVFNPLVEKLVDACPFDCDHCRD